MTEAQAFKYKEEIMHTANDFTREIFSMYCVEHFLGMNYHIYQCVFDSKYHLNKI